MNTDKSGGPAFPTKRATNRASLTEAYYESDGMSLRDYFAAKAMQVEIETASRSVKNADALVRAAGRNGMTIEQRIAHNAYSMADTMLAERSKP